MHMQLCTTKFHPVLEFFFFFVEKKKKRIFGKRKYLEVTVPNYPNTNANCRPNE